MTNEGSVDGQITFGMIKTMSLQDHSAPCLPSYPHPANPVPPLEPLTAPILVMIAAAAIVRRSSLVSLTQQLGKDSGNWEKFAQKVVVAAKVTIN